MLAAVAELVIFVGIQAAGKSTYFRERLAATHVHVSKDAMKTAHKRDGKQLQLIADALAAGYSVAVDNTNPTPAVRAPLIALGKRLGARVVALHFEAVVKEAAARNRTREGKARVPDVALYVTARKLVPPTLEEGFDEVRVVPALPPPA
jgi:predicted kinase